MVPVGRDAPVDDFQSAPARLAADLDTSNVTGPDGGFHRGFPFELPETRGPALGGILPTYSSTRASVQTEWGAGWDNSLKLVRSNFSGRIRYDDSDVLMSAWGVWKPGPNSTWVLSGVPYKAVATKVTGESYELYVNGTRWWFDPVRYGEGKLPIWQPRFAVTADGFRTDFQWNYITLKQVTWGSRDSSRPEYMLRFEYRKLPKEQMPESMLYGEVAPTVELLDRIELSVRSSQAGTFAKTKSVQL